MAAKYVPKFSIFGNCIILYHLSKQNTELVNALKLLNDGTIVKLKLFDQKSKNFLRLLIIFLED